MTMQETMARAICKASIVKLFGPDAVTQAWIDEAWPESLDAVQAALQSLREPTEGMIEAGENAVVALPEHGVADIFTAMIDAAINEGEQ